MAIWGKRRRGGRGRPRRTGGDTVPLDERKIDRLRAFRIELALAIDFETVDIECRTPVRQIAAYLGNPWWKARGVELQLHKSRARQERRILIAVRDARSIGKRIDIAHRHREPERRIVLESLRCR